MKRIYIIPVFIFAVLFSSCGKDENIVFDTPFISVEPINSSSAGPINTDQEFVGEYMLYMNAQAQSQSVIVKYEIIAGNGLVEGVDYQILTEGETQSFLPGIYDLAIRIKWLRTCVRDEDNNIISDTLDGTKNTTLTIRLLSNSAGFTLGYPGPDQKYKEIVIEKKKAE
ncbi:hypothetical protein [Dysgonomonas termitidis]|uniref:DUF4625 domain-containing protein n=1 Tax=Dysgonomonas termitidis TaxID=1516126 RepID=A0ABV9KRT1_9BACT